MISCDRGDARVVGKGNTVLAEWATLTYAIIRLFTENGEDKEFKEHLKERMCGALEMNFETAFKMSDGETFEEASRPMKERILNDAIEKWKSQKVKKN